MKFAREDDFLDAAVDTILPLYQLASASNSTGSAGLLLSATINAGSLMAKEGKLWLERIYRRLGGAVFHPSSLLCGSRSRHPSRDFFPRGEAPPKHRWFCEAFFFVPQDREGRSRVAAVRETGEGIFHCCEWAAGRRGRHLLQAYLEWSQGVPHRQRGKAIVAKVQFEEWPPHSLFPLWRVEQTWTSTAPLICCRKLTWPQCASLVRVWSSMTTGRIIHELHGFQVPAGQ